MNIVDVYSIDCGLTTFDLAYAGDSIYAFDTDGEIVETGSSHGSSPIVPPNAKRRKVEDCVPTDDLNHMDVDDASTSASSEVSPGLEQDDAEIEEEQEEEEEDLGPESHVPLILPKLRYRGVSNVRTIKDGMSPLQLPFTVMLISICSQLPRTQRRVCCVWFRGWQFLRIQTFHRSTSWDI